MTKKALIIVILFIVVVFIAGYKFITSQSANLGGLKVLSTPATNIFLDDRLIGKTPYEDKQPVGEHILKLIPQDNTTEAVPWQGKVFIHPSVLTFVNRELGISELTSAGEILTLEKNAQNEAQLAVSSQPNGATVIIDGQEKGNTPLFINNLIAGEHDVAVTSPGFVSRTVRVQTTIGYKLTVDFQLALSGGNEIPGLEVSVTPEASPSGKDRNRQQILIKDTPTGFLRVRNGPNTSASEVAQVKPGEKYTLIEEKEGWYKINYTDNKEGWVSARYAEKVD